jgi:hypothetical protein
MDLLTTRQVAERLDPPVTVSTISRWVAFGRITPKVRLPGSTGPMLFDPADVDKLQARWAAEQASAS